MRKIRSTMPMVAEAARSVGTDVGQEGGDQGDLADVGAFLPAMFGPVMRRGSRTRRI